ncbi:YggT family protein [Alterisphingorhabdus coralli]|uniref:YggT family protein n=1 Tax=Alterisphingorhabdus coralli TaxID=3071408 RepID=A0AA97F9C1_9SPHN|nr:YggT family protein [Parasphingorhabdus sp. SCSIO 66989]WOE75652.1 YggT family protein [Parasphingorhabdus sp. SCSIO 66989]
MLLLIEIVQILMNVLVMIIIVQFIIGLLIMFNVVSMSNQAVSTIYSSLNMLLDPILNPIRKIMPDTGAIDFSPLVLIIGLNILQRVLISVATQTM